MTAVWPVAGALGTQISSSFVPYVSELDLSRDFAAFFFFKTNAGLGLKGRGHAPAGMRKWFFGAALHFLSLMGGGYACMVFVFLTCANFWKHAGEEGRKRASYLYIFKPVAGLRRREDQKVQIHL